MRGRLLVRGPGIGSSMMPTMVAATAVLGPQHDATARLDATEAEAAT